MPLFKQRIYCPVCSEHLGDRNKNEFYTAHCKECRVTFIWKPGEKPPTAMLDKHKEKRCNCGRCKG